MLLILTTPAVGKHVTFGSDGLRPKRSLSTVFARRGSGYHLRRTAICVDRCSAKVIGSGGPCGPPRYGELQGETTPKEAPGCARACPVEGQLHLFFPHVFFHKADPYRGHQEDPPILSPELGAFNDVPRRVTNTPPFLDTLSHGTVRLGSRYLTVPA